MSASIEPRDMLADACGGAIDSGHGNADAWDVDRYAEHVRDRQVAIVALCFELLPEHAENLCDPYGDSFDAVEAVLHHLGMRAAILERLVAAGHVSEAIIDDLEEMLALPKAVMS